MVWRSGSVLVSINEVNLRRVRLVLGWLTVCGFSSWCRTLILVCNQLPRSTQPGHPFVGRRYEYQPKGGDALRLGIKGRYVHVWVTDETVWSRYRYYTQAISERFRDIYYKVLYKFIFTFTFTLLCTCVLWKLFLWFLVDALLLY